MAEPLPKVTVIIAARPGQADVKALSAARQFEYPADKLEIIVARGRQPSVQRNTAIRAAKGELIYFLDDDSVPQRENLKRAVRHFADRNVQMVGGPNLCPDDASGLERVFAVVLASWLAFGPSRARYWPVGNVRATGEKELILCNLAARRDALLEAGGFNEALYPNEENALMDELRNQGGRLIYDPEFIVHRRPRHTLKAFVRMLMTYGRGRAEQFRAHPTAGSMLNFVPPLFLFYIAALVGVAFIPGATRLKLWAAAPLGLYCLAVIVQTVASMPRAGIARSLCAMPLLFVSHLFYGAGFWGGLFTRLNADANRARAAVELETVPQGSSAGAQ